MPSKSCPLQKPLAATGTGKNTIAAQEAAMTRLSTLVVTAAQLQEIQYPSRPMNVESCAAESIRHGRQTCAPAEELAESKTCYVSFTASECVAVDAFQVKGPAWKMMEKGRDRMCAQVEKAHRTSAPLIQMTCLARCLEETLVRCP